MINLLQRAWDALDTFKQAYPENWHDEDEQVLKDLIRADLSLSGVKLKWVGLTDEEIHRRTILSGFNPEWKVEIGMVFSIVRNLEAKLKEKNG